MTKLTKGIAKLKNEIEKQARELNQRYPNPTHDSSFVSDPLWKKQQGDMERLERLKHSPDRFLDVFYGLLPTEIRKQLKKRIKDKTPYFDLNPLEFPLEGVKSEKETIEISVDDLGVVLDGLRSAVRYQQEAAEFKDRWWTLLDKQMEAGQLFMEKGMPGYDRIKTLQKASHIMGWVDPKKGKQKTLHHAKEIAMVFEYKGLIRCGIDKELAVIQISKNYSFANKEQCVRALRKLGLKELPSFSVKRNAGVSLYPPL